MTSWALIVYPARCDNWINALDNDCSAMWSDSISQIEEPWMFWQHQHDSSEPRVNNYRLPLSKSVRLWRRLCEHDDPKPTASNHCDHQRSSWLRNLTHDFSFGQLLNALKSSVTKRTNGGDVTLSAWAEPLLESHLLPQSTVTPLNYSWTCLV